jgi:Na+-transporting NADH:ubiquinone oxidoreductase subunit NqrB
MTANLPFINSIATLTEMSFLSLMLTVLLCRTNIAAFYRKLAGILIIADLCYASFMVGAQVEVTM